MRCTYAPTVRTFFWLDQDYYNTHKDLILEWAKNNNCEVPSERFGWVVCADHATAVLFSLTWS